MILQYHYKITSLNYNLKKIILLLIVNFVKVILQFEMNKHWLQRLVVFP